MTQQIDARHRWLFEKIADYCDLAPDVVEDQILDSDVSFSSLSQNFVSVFILILGVL